MGIGQCFQFLRATGLKAGAGGAASLPVNALSLQTTGAGGAGDPDVAVGQNVPQITQRLGGVMGSQG